MQNFGKPTLHTVPPQGEWLVLVRSTINSMIIQNLIDLYQESGFELYVHNLYGERPEKETENIRCVIYFRKIAA
jgi:hypothetical protein